MNEPTNEWAILSLLNNSLWKHHKVQRKIREISFLHRSHNIYIIKTDLMNSLKNSSFLFIPFQMIFMRFIPSWRLLRLPYVSFVSFMSSHRICACICICICVCTILAASQREREKKRETEKERKRGTERKENRYHFCLCRYNCCCAVKHVNTNKLICNDIPIKLMKLSFIFSRSFSKRCCLVGLNAKYICLSISIVIVIALKKF